MKDATRKKLASCAVVAAAFGLLYLLSMTVWKDVYLFEWTAWHKYLYIWAVALAFGAGGLTTVAYSVTLGNLAGILLGQFLGDFLVAQKVAKLPPNAGNAEVYLANYHHGAFIWAATVLAFFLIGLTVALWRKWKRPRETPE